MAMWFGRSRVEERVEENDEPVGTDRPSPPLSSTVAAPVAPPPFPSTSPPAFSPTAVAPLPSPVRSTTAIDALRAATTAAGANASLPSPDDVSQIGHLHAQTVAAERRTRRMLGRPGSRRKLQDARAAEAAALAMHGFSSYEGFAAIYEPPRSADETASESEATISRISELLSELGVDPLDDPLEAASAFLTAHEGAPAHSGVAEPAAAEHVVEHFGITAAMASFAPPFDTTPTDGPPNDAPAITPNIAVPAIFAAPPAPHIEPPISEPMSVSINDDEIDLHDPETPAVEVPAPEVWAAPPAPRPTEDEADDRWIHAEARAERMHAEVDRAQAELMAMLARSSDLEESVVTRDDELDAAQAHLATASTELERVQQRVAELEGSITRSDAEREDLERVLTENRDRVAQLEAAVLERERASVQATHERGAALQEVVELEATLALRTAELEAARAEHAAEIEAALARHASDLAAAHAQHTTELEAARVGVAEMEAELETTRGSALELATDLEARATLLEHTEGELTAVRATNDALTNDLEIARRALDALDAHAETIESELAETRRAVDSSQHRHETEMLQQELTAAQQELADARTRLQTLEAQHAATGEDLTRARAELQQLQVSLQHARDELIAAREETLVARDDTTAALAQAEVARTQLLELQRAIDATRADVDIAERARDAITVDTADLLARAEAQAAGLIERANRDAEAIRQEALRWEEGLREAGRRESGQVAGDDAAPVDHTPTELVDRIARLERKVADLTPLGDDDLDEQ